MISWSRPNDCIVSEKISSPPLLRLRFQSKFAYKNVQVCIFVCKFCVISYFLSLCGCKLQLSKLGWWVTKYVKYNSGPYKLYEINHLIPSRVHSFATVTFFNDFQKTTAQPFHCFATYWQWGSMQNAHKNDPSKKDKVAVEAKKSTRTSSSGKLEDKATTVVPSHSSATKAATTLEQWLERKPTANPTTRNPLQTPLPNAG